MQKTSTSPLFVPHVGWMDFFADDDVARFIAEGWFEYREQAFLQLYLRPGDIVIDAGAHAGLYSVLAGKITRGAGRTISIEPAPETAALLRANLARNGVENARVIEAALSNSNGRLAFHLSPPGKAAYDSLHSVLRGRSEHRSRQRDARFTARAGTD